MYFFYFRCKNESSSSKSSVQKDLKTKEFAGQNNRGGKKYLKTEEFAE